TTSWDNNNGQDYSFVVRGEGMPDTTPPTITGLVQTPPADAVGAGMNVTIQVSVVDDVGVANVTLVWSDNSWAEVKYNNMTLVSGNTYAAVIGPFTAGTRVEYAIRAYDTSGNVAWLSNYGANYVFVVSASGDTLPPSITSTSHTPSSPTPPDNITILTQVSDSGSGVKNVTLYWTSDGWDTINLTEFVLVFNTTYRCTIGPFPAGTTVIYVVRAYDNAGNVAWDNNDMQDYRIVITTNGDFEPPVIRTVENLPDEPKPSDTVTVRANISDNRGLASVIINYTSNNWTSYNVISMNLTAGSFYTAVLGSFADNTTVHYVIRATDINGLSSTSTGSFKVTAAGDSRPPWLYNGTHSPETPRPGQNVTIKVNARDNGTGIEAVMLFYTTTGWASVNSTPMTGIADLYSATIGPFADGTAVSYYFRATDKAGNTAVYNLTSFRFTVSVSGDSVPPEIKSIIVSPLSPKPADFIVVLSQVTDNSSNISSVKLNWTKDNWSTFTLVDMVLTTQNTYSATIGPFENGTVIRLAVVAKDAANNTAVRSTWADGTPVIIRVSTTGDTVPPEITNLTHSPAIPEAGKETTITVQVLDASPIASVILNYTIDGQPGYHEIVMRENIPARYSATLPAFVSGQIIRYRITASDIYNNTRTVRGTISEQPVGPAILLFNITIQGDNLVIRIETDPESLAAVRYGISNLDTEVESADFASAHTIAIPLSSFQPAAVYQFIAVLKDNNGFETTSAVLTYTIPRKNTAPTLTNGSVSPLEGDKETVFVFSVMYYDAEGDPPAYIRVVIDGVSYNMTPVAGTPGKYEYKTKLSPGKHAFFFITSDGNLSGQLQQGAFLVEVKEEKGLSSLCIGLIVGGVLVLIGGAAAVFYWFRKKGGKGGKTEEKGEDRKTAKYEDLTASDSEEPAPPPADEVPEGESDRKPPTEMKKDAGAGVRYSPVRKEESGEGEEKDGEEDKKEGEEDKTDDKEG
ncbi:MAG: hypothetical protein QW728_05905, partial [Thermoplasmata archaeon]